MRFYLKKIICLVLAVSFGLCTTIQNQTSARTLTEKKQVTNLTKISEFDSLSQQLCDSTSWDWKLILAMAYTESNFKVSVSSPRGATGLMQIMPHTAKDLGYAGANLKDPAVSIEIAIKLLDRISSTLRFPKGLSEKERLSVILASYNAGLGYMIETRKVAYQDGAAYNNWQTLRGYVTRNGTHRETVEYVDKVLKRYEYHKAI